MKLSIKHIEKDIFIVSYILLFLKSFHFKFFWGIPESVFLVITIVSSALYFSFNRKLKVPASSNSIIILLFSVILLQIFSNGGVGVVGQMSTLVSICCLILSDRSIGRDLFLAIRRVFAVVCLISLIGWILVFVFHCHIPYKIVTALPGYSFYDYGLFNVRVEGSENTRYLGMFLEPGYTGLLCALFLVTDRINLRKIDNIIILLAALFTLSLSSYVLLFISVLLLFPSRKLFCTVLIGCVICAVLCLFSHDIISRIDETILARIRTYYNSGRLFGNRFSDTFYVFYKEHILDSVGHYLFGIGSVKYLELGRQLYLHSAGYKVYVAEYGIINTFLVICLYWRIIVGSIFSYLKHTDIIFFFIWLLSFIISAYPTWCSFLIFIISASYYRNPKRNELSSGSFLFLYGNNDRYPSVNI